MAKDHYTIVNHPGCIGYAVNGVTNRSAAIAEARRHFEYQRAEAERFLSLSDAELVVRVVRGWHRQDLVRVLPPESEPQVRPVDLVREASEILRVFDIHRKRLPASWEDWAARMSAQLRKHAAACQKLLPESGA